ncbi:MAG: CBS domain-containing protein [Sulfolobaceae archaeon]
MKVKEIMETNPPVVSEDDKVIDALKKVNDRGIGRVIVEGNGKIVGLISTRDFLTVLATHCNEMCSKEELAKIGEFKVGSIMSLNPITVSEEDEVIEAINIMVARNFGSLPVINNKGKPVGIVTERDLLLMYRDMERIFPVNKFMTKKVTFTYPDNKVIHGIKQMIRRGFRRLPVVNNENKVIGIFTAADAVKLMAKAIIKQSPELIFQKNIGEVMTREIITVSPESSINDAAMILLTKSVGSLLILDRENRIEGIITERDMLIALHHQLHLKFV